MACHHAVEVRIAQSSPHAVAGGAVLRSRRGRLGAVYPGDDAWHEGLSAIHAAVARLHSKGCWAEGEFLYHDGVLMIAEKNAPPFFTHFECQVFRIRFGLCLGGVAACRLRGAASAAAIQGR